MLVTRGTFDSVVARLSRAPRIALDTETTGLRPYHGDKLFSLILADSPESAFYFNFKPYPGLVEDDVIPLSWLERLKPLFQDPSKTWYITKANFDMHFLGNEGIELAGEIHCTVVQGRVEYNEHMSYDLDSCLRRLKSDLAKDDRVKAWIMEHKAYTKLLVPGKQTVETRLHYDQVPPDIIVPYGCSDAKGTFLVGLEQEKSIELQASEFPPNTRNLRDAHQIERRLSKTIFRMERCGVRVDVAYCTRAADYELGLSRDATTEFKRLSGRDYLSSPKLFAQLFASEESKWARTPKGNPSFESGVLAKFENPLAKLILKIRESKSKADFYNGFLYHADKNGDIHPQFNAGGTRTFRFSSSGPNFQNLTSEDVGKCLVCGAGVETLGTPCGNCGSTSIDYPEFLVRRAIIPRPGFVLFMPDYDQVEYRMMLDVAKQTAIRQFTQADLKWAEEYFEVANNVAKGEDIHKATAEMMGVTRKTAKTLNFMLLYGGGDQKLADALGISLERAKSLKRQYFTAMPYVGLFLSYAHRTVKERGWIRNWAGYKYHFPDRSYAYTAPNTLIQGGCAAGIKLAMNEIDDLLLPWKSRLIMTVHDELPIEVHESEIHEVPKLIVEEMQSVYPYKHIPLTVGAEWSELSLADKRKGYPA